MKKVKLTPNDCIFWYFSDTIPGIYLQTDSL